MKGNFLELVKVLCIIASISLSAQAQLTELKGSTFIQVSGATSSWGDIDNDGDLDLFISGEDTVTRVVTGTIRTKIATAKLYKNNGGTSFSEIGTPIVGVIDGSSNFLDYDSDGKLDLFITGRNDASWSINTELTNTAIAKLYKGNGLGGFTEVYPGTFRGVQAGGTSAVGDYDSDGDVDIFVAGTSQLRNSTAILYRNDQEKGFFVDTRQGFSSLKGVESAKGYFIDQDKDGYLDLFYSGLSENGYRSYFYQNIKGEKYSLLQDTVGAPDASIAFADYDKNETIDRYLDGFGYNKTKKAFLAIPNLNSSPSAIFTDINNNGSIDLIIAGKNNSTGKPTAGIYEYKVATATFTALPTFKLRGVIESDISIADINKDGKIEVFLSGIDSTGRKVTKLYTDTVTALKTKLTQPVGLTFDPESLKLSWTASTDAPGNVSYSLDIELTDSTSGLRKIATRGDIQSTFIYTNGLSSGVYSAKVQAIDINYTGSAWSVRTPFTINKAYVYPAKDIRKTGNTLSYTASWANEPNATSIVLETSDNTEFTTNVNSTTVTGLTSKRITFGNPSSNFYYRIKVTTSGVPFMSNIQNFTVKTITEASVDAFTGVVAAASTFGDYDKDGDLDLLVTGGYGENKRSSKLYKNSGDGEYTEVLGTNFVGVENGSSNMMDIDNDGDLDIFIAGNNESTLSIHMNGRSRISQVYRNESEGDITKFTPLFTDIFEGTGSSSNNFADWDNDGDLDLFLSGYNGKKGAVCKIYQNDGTGFTALTIPFKGIYYLTNGSTTTGDYDNDGDLDFFVTGDTVDASGADTTDSKHRPISKLYRNDGGTAFVEQKGVNFPFVPVFLASADFGDYNNDEYLDLFVSGEVTATGTYVRSRAILYKNNGGTSFTADTASFQKFGVHSSTSIFGDFNNDGYSDLFLSGSIGAGLSGTGKARLFYNGRNGFSFANSDSTAFAGVGARASANFGDIDNDNDLDIFVAGWNSQTGPIAKMYRNNGTAFNTKPNVITLNHVNNIAEANVPASGIAPVTFSWSEPSDAPQIGGLSYNIYVGIKTNKNSVRSSHSDGSPERSGIRYVVQRGSIQGTSYTLSLKKGKRYFWSVQAIDAAFAGGQWVKEDSFEVGSITKDNQIITFRSIPTQTYAGIDINIPLSATSTSGLPVSFSSANTFVSISGNMLTIKERGTATITAYQIGNAYYNASEPVNQNVVIVGAIISEKTNQTITFSAIPTQTYSGTIFNITLSAASSISALSVSFSSANTFVSISGKTLTIKGTGTATITAYQAGNDYFNPAVSKNQTVVIVGVGSSTPNPPTPTPKSPLTAIEKNNSLIRIYPNPVKNVFHIEVDKTLGGRKYYQLISINGQEALNGYFTDSSSIQIPTIKSGYYVLLVFDNSGGLLQKEKIQVE